MPILGQDNVIDHCPSHISHLVRGKVRGRIRPTPIPRLVTTSLIVVADR